MRRVVRIGALAALALLSLSGCNSFNRTAPEAAGLRAVSAQPTAAEVVAVLNENARRIQSVEARDVDLDCTADGQSVGLRALVFCQKPRNFRMNAKVMGNVAADMGSNNQEFWYWISKAEPPYLYHCSYEDFARGSARLPFPFQPDWIMEAMGISEYDPSKPYEVRVNGQVIDLVENTVSPQGQPVRKITRLMRNRSQQLQVTDHMLQSARTGEVLCAAKIAEVRRDPTTGALIPHRVQLDWPEQKMRMNMRFDQVAVNPADLAPDRISPQLFVRPAWGGVQSFDLARGPDRGPGQLQTAGGYR